MGLHPSAPAGQSGSHDPESGQSVADGSALKGKRGLRRVLNALRYSRDGLRAAWEGEDAFRQEILLAAVLAPIALFLSFPVLERIALLGSLVLVLIVEILNTAVESAIDRQGLELNPLAKRAKDLGSAAVLLALLLTGAIWCTLLVVHFR
jgi:diacylglycerol kinase (ATP)